VTISGRQVEIATKLSSEHPEAVISEKEGFIKYGEGSVSFLELDAEKMGDYFTAEPNSKTFDCVWISEAMSHLPNKALFFQNVELLLKPGGRLVVADWFKSEMLTEKEINDDIKPIEGTTQNRRLHVNGSMLNFDRRNATSPTL
jgi:tocopherol O-methyltransferase